MCGLFGGVSSNLQKKDIERIRELGILSQLRGTDSTGIAVASIKKKKKYKWLAHKGLGNSSNFLAQEETNKLLTQPNTQVILGHTRLTTCGHTNTHNAHPINEKHIVGCHNGVIPALEPKGDDDKSKITDSRRLFSMIASCGLQDTINDIHYGGIAITYIDKQARTLNLFRNESKLLFLTTSPSKNIYYWASEKEFLELLLKRNNLHAWAEPWSLPAYEHWSFPLGSSTPTIKIIDRPRIRTHTVGSSGSALIQPNKQEWSEYAAEYGFCDGCWEELENCTCTRTTITSSTSTEYLWYNGQGILRSTAERLLAEGCFGCRKQYRVEDKVIWPHWDYYICKECSMNDFYKILIDHSNCYEGRLVT